MKTTRHLISLQDLPIGAAAAILAKAKFYKKNRGKPQDPLAGQTWGLLFSKPSTRTRVSFEVAIHELGGFPLFLNINDIQLSRGESIEDTAQVLGRMIHGMVFRTFDQKDVEDFAKHSNIPTINGLTDQEHPCQILTDIFTYEEKRGPIGGKKVAYIGDASSNTARSWIQAAKYFNFKLWIASPEKYQSSVSNANVKQVRSPEEAAERADLLYTDTWVSMGMEDEATKREKDFAEYQVNRALIALARREVLILHCLPVYRGKEISAELFERRSDDIFDQAENRIHVQKAILHWLVH